MQSIALALEQKFGSEGVDILPDIPQIQCEKQFRCYSQKTANSKHAVHRACLLFAVNDFQLALRI